MSTGARRRADAERNVAAILSGAVAALRTRSDASVEDIAKAAGVSRQTVYAHFRSREELLAAVLDHATGEVVAELDRAGADHHSAADALVALVQVSWQAFERYPFLLDITGSSAPGEDENRHAPVVDRLAAIVRRGRRAGEFDESLPAAWVVTAAIALGHAAGEAVGDGRMAPDTAAQAVRTSILRLVGAAEGTR